VIHHGDCVEVMAGMEPESVDAIVTDPPYGLEFMGKSWDRLGDVGKTSHPGPNDQPSKYGRVSFYGSANVRCRNCGKWKWGHKTGDQGGGGKGCECDNPDFPSAARRQGVAMQEFHQAWAREALRVAKPGAYLLAFGGTRTVHRLACAIEDAGWIIRDTLVWAYAQGFPKSKASLKPAWEPIVMARKPGPLRELAIDACRIGTTKDVPASGSTSWQPGYGMCAVDESMDAMDPNVGRWPSNVILTDPIFDGGIEGVVGGGDARAAGLYPSDAMPTATFNAAQGTLYDDSGTYSRFFLIPKADRADREPVLGGLPTSIVRTQGRVEGRTVNSDGTITTHGDTRRERANTHPTVKPTELMRHLVRLVTPVGGTVLDPFAGSGSTLLAAELEGFPWIGIEKEAEYVAIAEARLNGTQRGLGLSA
jgi:DNA modification methylase